MERWIQVPSYQVHLSVISKWDIFGIFVVEVMSKELKAIHSIRIFYVPFVQIFLKCRYGTYGLLQNQRHQSSFSIRHWSWVSFYSGKNDFSRRGRHFRSFLRNDGTRNQCDRIVLLFPQRSRTTTSTEEGVILPRKRTSCQEPELWLRWYYWYDMYLPYIGTSQHSVCVVFCSQNTSQNMESTTIQWNINIMKIIHSVLFPRKQNHV